MDLFPVGWKYLFFSFSDTVAQQRCLSIACSLLSLSRDDPFLFFCSFFCQTLLCSSSNNLHSTHVANSCPQAAVWVRQTNLVLCGFWRFLRWEAAGLCEDAHGTQLSLDRSGKGNRYWLLSCEDCWRWRHAWTLQVMKDDLQGCWPDLGFMC